MDKWAADADAAMNKDQKITQDEYVKFRTYIHRVGSIGCVSRFQAFETKKDNLNEQFSNNNLCKNKVQADCDDNTCQW